MISKYVLSLGHRIKDRRFGWRWVAPKMSHALACLRGGGLRFVEDEVAFRNLLLEADHPPKGSFVDYIQEVINDEKLKETFDKVSRERNLTKYRNWAHRVEYNRSVIGLTYGLIRELRPKLVVETGTASGSNTSMALAALHHNGQGELISIDIPPQAGKLTMDITIAQEEVGYWIPQDYKDRWTYLAGDAKIHLPKLMAERGVDFFIHDSLHTTSHMAFEYAVARAMMSENTIILSDDVLWNSSFDTHAELNRLNAYAGFSNTNFGGVVNRFSAEERAQGIGIVT